LSNVHSGSIVAHAHWVDNVPMCWL